MVHGETGAQTALKASEALFGGELQGLGAELILEIFSEVPSFDFERTRLQTGYSLIEALTESTATSSRGEARRLISGGGVYVNNRKMGGDETLTEGHLLEDRFLILRIGKKKYYLGQAK
jgi:tyrosyl-tRNA synthetase